ncbi:hypothetical protein E2542_SST22249 [Spatholobus suberectus]|nr:hypothetical protein E2542_SST22249 [Spatholobus suberectus]
MLLFCISAEIMNNQRSGTAAPWRAVIVSPQCAITGAPPQHAITVVRFSRVFTPGPLCHHRATPARNHMNHLRHHRSRNPFRIHRSKPSPPQSLVAVVKQIRRGRGCIVDVISIWSLLVTLG